MSLILHVGKYKRTSRKYVFILVLGCAAKYSKVEYHYHFMRREHKSLVHKREGGGIYKKNSHGLYPEASVNFNLLVIKMYKHVGCTMHTVRKCRTTVSGSKFFCCIHLKSYFKNYALLN